MGILTRFKSNEKLQAEALDILNELIKRDLLTVDVLIEVPPCIVTVKPGEAYITGSRSLSGFNLFRARITGEMPKKNSNAGPGICLNLRDKFRFGTVAEEKHVSEVVSKGL